LLDLVASLSQRLRVELSDRLAEGVSAESLVDAEQLVILGDCALKLGSRF
jgi:hypothetical protein